MKFLPYVNTHVLVSINAQRGFYDTQDGGVYTGLRGFEFKCANDSLQDVVQGRASAGVACSPDRGGAWLPSAATCDSGQSSGAPSPPLLTAGGWAWGLVPEAGQDLAVLRSG